MATTMRASVLTAPQTIELQERPVPGPGPRRGAGPGRLGRRVRLGRALLQARPDRVEWSSRARWCSATRSAAPSSPSATPWTRHRVGPAGRARAAAAVPPLPAVQDRAPEPLPATWSSSRPRRSTARSATTSPLPADFAHPVPDSLSDAAVGLLEPLSVGHLGQPEGRHHGRSAGCSSPAPDRSARWPALSARAMGATEIIVSDPVESRRQRITELASAPAPSTRRDAVSTRPTLEADVFLECSGPTLALLDGMKALRPGGTAVMVGTRRGRARHPAGAGRSRSAR